MLVVPLLWAMANTAVVPTGFARSVIALSQAVVAEVLCDKRCREREEGDAREQGDVGEEEGAVARRISVMQW